MLQSSGSVDSSKERSVREKREAKPGPIIVFPGFENLQSLFNLNGNVTKTGTITITFGASGNKTSMGSKGGNSKSTTTTTTMAPDSRGEKDDSEDDDSEDRNKSPEESMEPFNDEDSPEERRLFFNRRG